MDEWRVEEFGNTQLRSCAISGFPQAFPNRSKCFFERAVSRLDPYSSRLFLLVVDHEVKGGVFAFRILGYGQEVWSPSYLYVDVDHRSLSLPFLMVSLARLGKRVIDVSPTQQMKKILKALRYSALNKGSYVTPLPIALLRADRLFRKTCISTLAQSPIPDLLGRNDLIWYSYFGESETSVLCVKRSSRYGIPVFIVAYCDTTHLKRAIPALATTLARTNPFGLLVWPRFEDSFCAFGIRSYRFHAFANFPVPGSIYSVLGSEVTEII